MSHNIYIVTEIDSRIYEELQQKDWDLLIAHYLGVDHAGHRYGPNHPEMARKLKELNQRLSKIIEVLPSDVILYVIGDHGMTETGNNLESLICINILICLFVYIIYLYKTIFKL